MAERRCLSLSVIDSDDFLKLSLSEQTLFFHLAMRCDDDGFTNKARTILLILGLKEDALKSLEEHGFILIFDECVCVKPFLAMNTIKKDRYSETQFIDVKNALILDKNKWWNQAGTKLETQKKIKENKINKNNINVNGTNLESLGNQVGTISDKELDDLLSSIENIKDDKFSSISDKDLLEQYEELKHKEPNSKTIELAKEMRESLKLRGLVN